MTPDRTLRTTPRRGISGTLFWVLGNLLLQGRGSRTTRVVGGETSLEEVRMKSTWTVVGTRSQGCAPPAVRPCTVRTSFGPVREVSKPRGDVPE